jgi:hypothetical protein
MDFNASHPENTPFSIRVSLELDSNVKDEMEEHERKHSVQRTSTDDGIQIDFNKWQR